MLAASEATWKIGADGESRMSDINPYAAPSVPDPLLDDRGPAGGPWRDGKFLVIHRLGGDLPHICLLTGEPADVRLPVQIQWSYPIDYSMRTTWVQVGLTQEARLKSERMGLIGCWAHLVSIVAIIAIVSLSGQMSRLLFLSLFAPFLLTVVVGMICSHYSKQLRFVKARGEYIWLRGAGPRFLDQLPVWPVGR